MYGFGAKLRVVGNRAKLKTLQGAGGVTRWGRGAAPQQRGTPAVWAKTQEGPPFAYMSLCWVFWDQAQLGDVQVQGRRGGSERGDLATTLLGTDTRFPLGTLMGRASWPIRAPHS